MKNTKKFILIISLFVCLTHTMGLCFVSHSPQILETINYKLKTDSYDITAGAIPKPTLQRTALNTFDAADKLISSSVRYGQGADSTEHITETFQYDGNGALTNWLGSPLWKGGGGNAAGGLSLTYDALGQVAKVAQTFLSAFSYDALGNRVVMDGNLWIPNHSDSLKRPLMETDLSGNIIRYYIWGDNRLLGFIDSNGILTVAHSDEIGSVIALTDLSGNIFYIASYGSHGEDWGSSGNNPTPFAWLGGYGVQTLETDTPLKLYLTRHRVYSATLNRFLSSDPIGLAGGNNLYAYGEGNPMAYIDPLGLCAEQSVWGAFWEGFGEGWRAGWEINFNTLSLGMTDSLGWTDSGRHEGTMYDVSRGLAAVGTIALAQAGALAVTEVAGSALVGWGAGAAGAAGAGAVAQKVAQQPVFWSGTGTENAARAFANANNGIVLADTAAGRAVAQAVEGLSRSHAQPLWATVSENFARSASGQVNVILNATEGLSPNSIFWLNEFPILLGNPNVTGIIYNYVTPAGSIIRGGP